MAWITGAKAAPRRIDPLGRAFRTPRDKGLGADHPTVRQRMRSPMQSAASTTEGRVSNGKRRKTKVETLSMASKSRRTQPRPVAAERHGHPLGVGATKLPRRQFLHLAAGAAALPAVSRIAWAQAYPTRPVRIIVGFPAGGASDLIARLMGQWLSDRLGQQFIVENRSGATTNIATEAVVNSPPDGYTLLLCTGTNAINATFFDNLNFNFIRDIVPVASIVDAPIVMEVHPSVPARTVAEFIAYAKANPGKLNMGSSGTGTGPHVAGELFKMMTGVDMIHVPYRGSAPAVADLLGGQVQVMFDVLAASIEQIRSGKLRALAVATTTRLEALPEVPIMGDFLPGYVAGAWQGLGAPKNTPTEIVDRLNKEINAALADAKIKARLADFALTPLPGSPAEFRKLIAEDTERWAKVVKFSGAKPGIE
jgi:tripartite-type tricarboxylate transporter receptor subunit TctC